MQFAVFITGQLLFNLILEGKALKDDETLGSLGLSGKKGTLYFKDLGPQIGWTTVSIASCNVNNNQEQ